MMRSWHRCIFLSTLGLAGALAAGSALAEKAPAADRLIKPLLAKNVGDAICFSGAFEGLKVNVWDYSTVKHVPVEGLFRFGEQVTRPEPYVHVDQELATMTLLLKHEQREVQYEPHKPIKEEVHAFRLKISLQGWPAALQAAGDCSLGRRAANTANGTTLYCGIDCDGGSGSVERIAGTDNVIFRFGIASGGLRMSGGCSRGPYHVGGEAKPYEKPRKAHRPASFRLTPMPADACAAFQKAMGD